MRKRAIIRRAKASEISQHSQAEDGDADKDALRNNENCHWVIYPKFGFI